MLIGPHGTVSFQHLVIPELMRSSLFYPSFLFLSCAAALSIALAGCSSPTSTTTLSQEVWNIAWLPNESGMIAISDQVVENASGTYDTADNVYRVNTSGSIGNALNSNNADPDANYWNAPIIYLSTDGSTAIVQYGTDIYSIALGSGTFTDIIQNTQLFGVSSDGKYAVTTTSSPGSPNKYLVTYDLTANPPTPLPSTDVPGLLSNRVLWLNNDEYAITILDSGVYSHVAIYNAEGGVPVMVIPNATVEFSSSAFSPDSNDLFVETSATGIDRINLTSGTRIAIVTDSIASMDVSSDGTVLVYTSNSSLLPYGTMYAVNLANLHIALVPSAPSGVVKPIISPRHDFVACVQLVSSGSLSSNIGVYGLSIPP
jgi:dipeptidyl aminopeptidase/acylaminoacyl peptidase